MAKFASPLRYPGGKRKIAPFIKSLFRENNLVGLDYLEPYAGGAGVALSLLFDEYVTSITINDLDRSIYAFWHSVVHDNERFCEAIQAMSVDIKTWEKQKEIQKEKDTTNLFELGISTFFLNRTNVSGVIKGGIIGGKSQLGTYKINARFNKKDLIERIKKINQYKDRIIVKNSDTKEILSENLTNKFVYLDPPYVTKGKGLYMNYYVTEDHKEISDYLMKGKSNFRWVLSYDNHPLIQKLYARCKKQYSWGLNYSTSQTQGIERVFLHPELKCKKSISALPQLITNDS